MQDLDIIPIVVVSETQNKAEMLNGLLRGEGLAVHPQWVQSMDAWDALKTNPELVFYFEDTPDPALEDVVSRAKTLAAAVIVVSARHDPDQAAKALEAGAAAQVSLADTQLLAGIARRERNNRGDRKRLRTLEREVEESRKQLRNLMAGGQNAIAYAQEGVIAGANRNWAEMFGFHDEGDLIGLPVMDLFAQADQQSLKLSLRALTRGKPVDGPLAVHGKRSDGAEFELGLDMSPVEVEGESQIQFMVSGNAASADEGAGNTAALKQIDELEAEKRRLELILQTREQREPDSQFLWPSTFAPIAAERVNRPLAGTARALVAFRPADAEKAMATFGPLGLAEAGASIPVTLSPLMDEDDLVVRIDGLTVLATVNRASEQAIEDWAKKVLNALGEHIFETSSRSSLLGFVAGIAPIDRVRRLEQLTHQALKAATGEPNTVHRAEVSSVITTADTDDAGWSAMIAEALEEQRFAIALRPIEDLANASKLYEATARLLDREGKEIPPEGFMEPAQRLGLARQVERRLIGHAFMALLRLLQSDESTRVILPLSPAVMQDDELGDFLLGLVTRTKARLPVKSLVFELGLEDALHHVAEIEPFAREMQRLNCGFGLREFVPADNAEKLLERLELDVMRLSPQVVARLGDDEQLTQNVQALLERLSDKDCRIIASGVNDANLMAQLYNLGISMVEGSAIGDAEVFNSRNPMFEGLGQDD